VTTPGKSDSATSPTILRAAFWTAVVGATIILIGAALALSVKQQMADAQINKQGQTLTPDQITQAVNVQVWLLAGFSLVFGLFAAFFARKLRDGELKARVRLTIVTILLVLFLFFFGNLIGLAGAVVLLVAVAMTFTPTATRYLKPEL
jgi:NhaP-type Na+/H+ or K+/H+ antiporter